MDLWFNLMGTFYNFLAGCCGFFTFASQINQKCRWRNDGMGPDFTTLLKKNTPYVEESPHS
jgi:hypothetical protein